MVRGALAIGLWAIGHAWAFSQGVLIIQTVPIGARNPDEGGSLSQMLAQRFDTDGRLRPVVWSITDPIFRTAVNEGLIKEEQTPSLVQLVEAAKKLRCEYILEVGVWRRDNVSLVRAKLFKGDQLVWRDPVPLPIQPTEKVENSDDREAKNFDVTGGRIDDLLVSLADTWFEMLINDPLKSLRPQIKAPDTTPTNVAPPKTTDPPPVRRVDNQALMADAMKRLAAKDTAGAIAVLREGVDAEPLDRERRRALIETLVAAGFAKEAAVQARRAARALPESAEFWVLAARAGLSLNQAAEVEKDLNEAVARDPKSAETRLLLAEIALLKGDPNAANPHLEAAFAIGPSADGWLLRALTQLALGQDAAETMKSAREAGAFEGPRSLRAFDLAVRVASGMLDDPGVPARALFEAARRNRTDARVGQLQTELRQKIRVALALAEAVEIPKAFEASAGDRQLALKLLSQSLSELDGFLQSGDEEALGDASLTLAEALRRLKDAETRYAAERALGEMNEPLASSIAFWWNGSASWLRPVLVDSAPRHLG